MQHQDHHQYTIDMRRDLMINQMLVSPLVSRLQSTVMKVNIPFQLFFIKLTVSFEQLHVMGLVALGSREFLIVKEY